MDFEKQSSPQELPNTPEERDPQSFTFEELLQMQSATEQTATQPSATEEALPQQTTPTQEAEPVAKPKKQEQNIYEYEQEFQREGILHKYRRAYQKSLRSLAVLGVLTLLALIYECLPDTAIQSISPLYHPIRYILWNNLFWILGIAVVFEPFWEGLKGLFTGKPTPRSLLGFLVMGTVLYQLIVFLFWGISKEPTCPQPAALFLLFFCMGALLLQILEVRRELFAFAQMSTEGEKTILVHDAKTDTYHTEKTSFVSDFYRNGRGYCEKQRCIYFFFGVAFVFALIFFFLYIGKMGVWEGLRCAYVAFMMAAPISLAMLFAFPQFRLARALYQQDGMVLSEQTTQTLANARAIEFSDSALFSEQCIAFSDLRIYENYPIDRALGYLGSTLKEVDCAMARSFLHTVREMHLTAQSELTELCEGGLCAKINGQTILEFGDAPYLRAKGYGIHTDTDPAKPYTYVYLAIDSQIVATMAVQYTLRDEFAKRLPRCRTQGLQVTVRSCDPLLRASLLQAVVNPVLSDYHLLLHRVQRGASFVVSERHNALASTTAKDELVLLDAVLSSYLIWETMHKHQFTMCVFALLSLFGMAILQGSSVESVLHAKALLPLLYQVFCNAVMAGLLWFDEKKRKDMTLWQ